MIVVQVLRPSTPFRVTFRKFYYVTCGRSKMGIDTVSLDTRGRIDYKPGNVLCECTDITALHPNRLLIGARRLYDGVLTDMKAWRKNSALSNCILTYFLLGKLLCCSEAQGTHP